MDRRDDIQYALETTEVLHEPDRRIDTFGSTSFEFVLITELMDSVDRVRVREGRINAERPRIMTPDAMREMKFEGFGEQAEQFEDWVRANIERFKFLQYGFQISRTDLSETIVHEPFDTVSGRVVDEVFRSGNPLKAVIGGVDDVWEISLLRFTLEMVASSHETNAFDLKRRGLL